MIRPGLEQGKVDRRTFFMGSACALAGVVVPQPLYSMPNQQVANRFLLGPAQGHSPLVGTLVSMLNWMRPTVLRAVEGLSQEELDTLYDSEANTIGALLMHLGGTEVNYQRNTLGQRDYTRTEMREWRSASNLGAEARNLIKGHPLDYYLSRLEEVRAKTLEELRLRDDEWLAEADPSGPDGLLINNFSKWFHVCEHESNHRGQIIWLRKRLPGRVFAHAVRR